MSARPFNIASPVLQAVPKWDPNRAVPRAQRPGDGFWPDKVRLPGALPTPGTFLLQPPGDLLSGGRSYAGTRRRPTTNPSQGAGDGGRADATYEKYAIAVLEWATAFSL